MVGKTPNKMLHRNVATLRFAKSSELGSLDEKEIYIKTLLMLMLFSKTILLTAIPIFLGNYCYEIAPEEPLVAITGGARIAVDITNLVKDPFNDIEVTKKFPDGIIKGKLIAKDGTEIELTSKGSSHNKQSARLIVSAPNNVPTDKDFIKVKIKSDLKLENVSIFWVNGMH